MNTDLMFSSANEVWATPQDFYDKLNDEFIQNDLIKLKIKNHTIVELNLLMQKECQYI